MQKILKQYAALVRHHQWLKNLLLFFPPFFGGKMLDPSVLKLALPSFLSFSLAASCGYIINDIQDKERDGYHASKKFRPIAQGNINLVTAIIIAVALYVTAMLVAGTVSQRFEGYLIIYLLVSFCYTIYFKNFVLLDIFFVAFGFVMRVLAGGEAFQVKVTNWLFLTVFIVAILLATGKRLGEMVSEGANALQHRISLSRYSSSFLEGVLWFSASCALVTYALYIIENRDGLIYTVPIAVFGLLRYIYVVKQGQGDPTDVLLKDRQIMLTGLIWVAMIGVIIY